MIVAIILSVLPSFLQVPLRRLLGQKIGKASKIKFGSIVKVGSLNVGSNCKIGPFCYVKAETLEMGDHSQIKALSILSTRIVKLGKYTHIAPLAIISSEFTKNSLLELGDHVRIFPFTWLDTGESIRIGKQSGVGANSSIYTHGVWSDYLDGGPVTFGPVTIKDNVWIPSKVMILPNVEIGENTIVGTNSVVSKSFGSNLLIGGTPAKVIRENVNTGLGDEERGKRISHILNEFSSYVEFKLRLKSEYKDGKLTFKDSKVLVDDLIGLNKGDLLLLVNMDMSKDEISTLCNKGISVLNHKEKVIRMVGSSNIWPLFVSFVRRYGIRLYIE